MFVKALAIASQAHAGQVDKLGQPFMDHLAVIAAQFDNEDDKSVAVLHDVLASGLTLDALLKAGIPQRVVERVAEVSQREDETFLECIDRIKRYPSVIAVKIAEMEHELKTEARLPGSRASQYIQALEILRG
jgi:(p)ppGpp synthase/HD superfamily hydrolase